MLKIQKLTIFSILLVCIGLTSVGQNTDHKSKHLADSIYNLLKTGNDSVVFEPAFSFIKRNRRALKKHYLELLFKYDSVCRVHNYQKGSMEALDRIGLTYRYDGLYDSAEVYHNQSLNISLILLDSIQLYYNFNNLGQVYRMQDLSVPAINYLHKALSISEQLSDEKKMSYTMNSLGAAYVVQKDFKMAMHYFRRSAQIGLSRNDSQTVAYNYGAMGEVFLKQENYDSAMYYFIETDKIVDNLKWQKGKPVSLHLIGQAHFALGNYTEAEKYMRNAISMHKKRNKTRYLSLCYAYLGKIKTKQKITDSAEYYLQKAYNLAESVHSYEHIILSNDGLFELYRNSKQYEKAITALQQSKAFEDSIISIANAKELKSLEIIYETQKKEQRIKLLSAENKIKSQNIKIAIILIVVLCISVVFGIYFQLMKKRQAEFAQNKLRQQLMLSQMNPHFIFNALASIQAFMYKNDGKKAAVFLQNFSSLTRSILNNSSEDSITLSEEIETLKNYLELEKLRMNGAFNYNIHFDNEIEIDFISVPPMLLQPFIENAVKHGMRSTKEDGSINLSLIDKGNMLEIEITDNGIGVEAGLANPTAQHQSKATTIFKQRLKILQRKYRNIPDPIIMDLKNEGKKGTKVIVYLPILS